MLIVRNSGKSSLACEGSVKSDTGRRAGREGPIHMGKILNLSKRQMYLLKVIIQISYHLNRVPINIFDVSMNCNIAI